MSLQLKHKMSRRHPMRQVTWRAGFTFSKVGAVYILGLEPIAGTIPDYSGNGNDVINHNGWAITTDGVADNVVFPHTTDYDLAGVTVTISGYFRISSAVTSTSAVISKGGWVAGWAFIIDGANVMTFFSKQASSTANHSYKTFGTAPVSQWVYFSLVVTNGVLQSATINGVARTLSTVVATTGTYGDSTLPLYIAISDDGSTKPWPFAADLSHFQIVDSAGTEIFAANLQDHPPSSLDGLPAFDASGNGNHGTYVGGDSFNAEGMPDEVAKLGAFEDNLYLTRDGQYVTTTAGCHFGTGDFDFTYKCAIFTGGDREIAIDGGFIALGSSAMFAKIGASFYNWVRSVNISNLNTVRFVRSGTSIALYINGVSWGTKTILVSDTFNVTRFNQLNDPNLAAEVVFADVDFGNGVTWDGTEQGATENGWTVSGSPKTVGDLRRTIPQMYLQDWNRRNIYTFYRNESFSGIEGWTANPFNLSESGGYLVATGTGGTGFSSITDTSTTYPTAKTYTFIFTAYTDRVGGGYLGITKDIGLQYIHNTVTLTGTPQTFTVSGVPNAGGRLCFSASTTFKTSGNFPASTAWETDEKIYITDITVTETGADYFLPASLADPTKDALGNDIDNLRGNLLNPTFVAGDYAEILDDPSLDVTTQATWFIVGNLYGGNLDYIFHRWELPSKRSWAFYQYSASELRLYVSGDGAAQSYIAIPLEDSNVIYCFMKDGAVVTIYKYESGVLSGVAGTPVGTIPASLFTTDIPIRIGSDFDGNNPSDKQMMPPLFYSRAMLEEEITQHCQLIQEKFL